MVWKPEENFFNVADDADSFLCNRGHISLLCDDKSAELVRTMTSALARQGFEVTSYTRGEDIHTGQDIIAMTDIDRPFFEKITEASFVKL